MPQENLFSSFEKYSLEDWKSFILNDLKGDKYESLVSQTPEGIPIEPVYQGYSDTLNNFFNPIQQENEALAVRNWVNNYHIIVKEEKAANIAALEVLNAGADGLIFEISETVNLKELLKGIEPIYCNISFKTKAPNFQLIQNYITYLSDSKYDLNQVAGNYFVDIIEKRDAGAYSLDNSIFDELATCIKQTAITPNFKCLHISGLLYHNAGANSLNELSLLFSKTAEYLDKLTDLGLSIAAIANSMVFSTAFGSNFFFEIAKAKVLRKNIQKVFQAYDYQLNSAAIKVVGYTSDRTKSALDFNVNLLRNTTEAMSAILAGCNEIYIAPHDSALEKNGRTTFKRIALNISSLLKEEAHFDKVADPTMGSYYLEALISNLEEKSWEAFLTFEKQASYSKLFEDGTVKSIIKADDQKSADAVLSRKSIYIGANMFQNIGEKLSLDYVKEEDDLYLHPKRIGWKLENIRAQTENFVNKNSEASRPTATLISFGTDPVSKAKADFAYSFLGMAGIKIADEVILKNLSDLEDALKKANTSLIVYCYPKTPDLQSSHFKHPTAKIIIAGPNENEEKWKEEGLYAFINRNVNAYHFLQNLLNDLKIEA